MAQKKKKLVVLTGAGMSAESGIATFRGSNGLWENHRIEDVASPEGWRKDPHLVLDFYNQRRKNVLEVAPNRGHIILAELQKDFDVQIITQNIDDLHERAGSKNILHLHGEIRKSRSTGDPDLIYNIKGWELKWGDRCEKGYQLRPHIVWFGEAVPMIEPAADLVSQADIFVVVGTSLQVYPAAGLVAYASAFIPKYIIDPFIPETGGIRNMIAIEKGAGEGLEELAAKIR
ncbi:MAG: NAD-dependent deacylase [Flavobacteriales bacterium]|nr:NAD-dependent deacylase [Flavobacteriales bacterium]